MRSVTRVLFTSAMLAVANAQGNIVKAVGDKGTSTGLQGLFDSPSRLIPQRYPDQADQA